MSTEGSVPSRSRPALLVLASMFFVLAGLLVVQTSLASTLSGHVTSVGQPVSGAFVAATGPNGDAGAVSDSGGAFSLTIPDGTYTLAANAPGFAAAIADGVSISGATVHDLSLTASGAKLTKLPIFGGGGNVAADGTPGVFYVAGGNVGNLYRSVDWGGTWTQVNVARDDATNGLSGAASPSFLTTSGVPGEVAVAVGAVPGLALPSGVFYSTNYGVTWHPVANSVSVDPGTAKAYWGHAGSRSVLVARTALGTAVADMTAPNPSWVQMTTPYAPIGQPIAVGDGGDQPWLATVDASGQLSVYPLLAQAHILRQAPSPRV